MEGARRRLRLDATVVLEALVARDEGLLATYVDLTNGQLLRLYDPAITGRTNEDTLIRLDREPERFAEIPRYSRMYRLMADFVDAVEDDHLARLLDTALTGRGAFRRFEVVLAAWPGEYARWQAFREAALVRWTVAWLRPLGFEPDWDLASPPEAPAEIPVLLRVAILGAPDGIGTRVHEAADEGAAIALFVRLARQLCELRCEPFPGRTLRDRTSFVRGGVEIRRMGTAVALVVC